MTSIALVTGARGGIGRALCVQLQAQGWQVPDGRSPIIPVIIGDEARTLALAAQLRQHGHHAPAIRPPTVPEGSCRLRLTVTRAHRPKDLRQLAAAMARLRSA